MKHVVHVHQQKIRKGEPAIIDRTYRGSTRHRGLEILSASGEVVARIVQSDKPDSCGARVWIECTRTRPLISQGPSSIVEDV